MSRPHHIDTAQPFAIDVHPMHCDCPACDDSTTAETSLRRTFAGCAVAALAAVIAGQLIGRALCATGILALLGIG